MASIAVLLQLRHDRGGAVFSLLPTYPEHDLQNFVSYTSMTIAWLHLRAGDWREAEQMTGREIGWGSTVPQLLARTVLAEVIRLAGRLVEASGEGDELGLRDRALEIAALAETLLWSVDPDASDWLLDLYDR